jgi:hypothetical protein
MKYDASIRKATAKAQLSVKKGNRKAAVTEHISLEKKAESSKKMKPVTLASKIEPKIKKNKSGKLVQAVKPKIKKAEVVALVKTPKTKIVANKSKNKEFKSVASVTEKKADGKKLKSNKASQRIKPKTKSKQIIVVAPPESTVRKLKSAVSAKQIKAVEKKKILLASIKSAKKPVSAIAKLKASKKSKNDKPVTKILQVKKTKIVEKKDKQNTVAHKPKPQPKNNKVIETVQVVKLKTGNNASVKPFLKLEDKKTKNKSAKSNKAVSVKEIKPEKKENKLPALAKTIRLERNKVIKAKAQKNVPVVAAKTVKAIEIEVVNLPVEKKPVKKKNKSIGSAIFRGRKDRYDFKVFPLDNDFEDVSAIYVISRRKIDRQKKGHHALVCIGQTDSILGELKRHKNKCIKKHNANVISILPETDEKKRIKIEEDLRAAHAIACNID